MNFSSEKKGSLYIFYIGLLRQDNAFKNTPDLLEHVCYELITHTHNHTHTHYITIIVNTTQLLIHFLFIKNLQNIHTQTHTQTILV